MPVVRSEAKATSFGHAVVEGALACGHLDALLEELLDLGVDVEAGGIAGGEAREFEDALGGEAGGRFRRSGSSGPPW